MVMLKWPFVGTTGLLTQSVLFQLLVKSLPSMTMVSVCAFGHVHACTYVCMCACVCVCEGGGGWVCVHEVHNR